MRVDLYIDCINVISGQTGRLRSLSVHCLLSFFLEQNLLSYQALSYQALSYQALEQHAQAPLGSPRHNRLNERHELLDWGGYEAVSFLPTACVLPLFPSVNTTIERTSRPGQIPHSFHL